MSIVSPLAGFHTELGARMTDFSGWQMPLQYESVLAEHRAVRGSVGWFDVSHLGRFRCHGPGATETLRHLFCNDVSGIEPGRSQYTMMLNDGGGVVDDLIVWRWDDDDYWVLPNAANHERVMKGVLDHQPQLEVEDLRPATAAIAVQGPEAPELLERVLGSSPRRFRTFTASFAGAEVRGAGTGYTGERGGELVIEAPGAGGLARTLTESGAVPCGLGARDTLRLEAGLPLWGQELDEETSPLEAGLEFAVAWDHEFVGRAALERQRAEGPPRRLIGFVTQGRVVPRHGYPVRIGGTTGVVTSGNFSPMLERGIGLAYVPFAAEGEVEVEVRGRWHPADLVDPPFYRKG